MDNADRRATEWHPKLVEGLAEDCGIVLREDFNAWSRRARRVAEPLVPAEPPPRRRRGRPPGPTAKRTSSPITTEESRRLALRLLGYLVGHPEAGRGFTAWGLVAPFGRCRGFANSRQCLQRIEWLLRARYVAEWHNPGARQAKTYAVTDAGRRKAKEMGL